jgi:hypothetical protein
MNRYFTRTCPRCKGHVGIIIRKRKKPAAPRPVNGRCLDCNYRLAWLVIDGKRSSKTLPIHAKRDRMKAGIR